MSELCDQINEGGEMDHYTVIKAAEDRYDRAMEIYRSAQGSVQIATAALEVDRARNAMYRARQEAMR